MGYHQPDLFQATAQPLTEHQPVVPAKVHRGQLAYLAGHAAEDQVANYLCRDGFDVLARRWRCKAGELDLVARKGGLISFIEVKRSSSFERAIESLSARQLSRISIAAECYLDAHPQWTPWDRRVDLAAVDGVGRIRILENVSV